VDASSSSGSSRCWPREPAVLGELVRSGEVPFALSLARIPLAYRLGSMRLGLLVAERRA
jgi:hypothetical protein